MDDERVVHKRHLARAHQALDNQWIVFFAQDFIQGVERRCVVLRQAWNLGILLSRVDVFAQIRKAKSVWIHRRVEEDGLFRESTSRRFGVSSEIKTERVPQALHGFRSNL